MTQHVHVHAHVHAHVYPSCRLLCTPHVHTAVQAEAFAGFDLVMLDEAHDCTACQVQSSQPLTTPHNT
jgi:hypothetical protein